MRVLVVEDETVSRKILSRAVRDEGHRVFEAASGDEAWKIYRDHPVDVVLSDWFMPGTDGLELCRRIRADAREKYTYFILITVASGKSNVGKAMAVGIDDFLSKPLDRDELRFRLQVAARITGLHRDAAKARARITFLEEKSGARRGLEGMLGKCSTMQELFRRIRLAAQSPVSTFLHGESGTGKELAASAIHALSERADGPFVAVDCGALPESILESELFGHVKGAFTGAHRDKAGLFELAHEGTLFLDEIGDVSPTLQQKLLRAIEEGEIRRVGGDEPTRVDVRLITATHHDLQRLVEEGRFRKDLYYRVRVFQLDLPPLRERREDIPLLLEHFLDSFNGLGGKHARQVDAEALRCLVDYDWPGNVRELRNAIEHAFVTLQGETLRREDLPPEIRERRRPAASGAEDGSLETEAEEVLRAVEKAKGNRTRAAELLGISRVALWKRIRRHGLQDVLPPPPRGRRARPAGGA